ncbi:MerR family transcriptional regulator [Porphyromonas crevioricanis]|uniref:HTH merR-type domain-containing protein n=2 Tax=Porphyromonas crevioricanis TaxID=393921 RepID=A0A2X4PI92_9PORP|nr:MerR family transcriptional regulator [Porphyromonas crevioricanis]SQH72390.1 Uncharacterised protein [Porphyromonas crevioricanis]
MSQRKFYYSIGEVAHQLNEPVSTIRHWESQLPELRPRTSRRGTRLYRQEDIDRLMTLRILIREQGLTIEGAKRALSQQGDELEGRIKAITLLKNIRGQLFDLRRALDQTERKSMLTRLANDLQLDGILPKKEEPRS